MIIRAIIVAVIMLGVLVTIHELGHFFVARLLKIKAYEVSIFVGPKLIDWRKNDVEYSIRALPFGAYVRFNDFDENGNIIVSDDPTLLENSPRWKRLIVALAGPFMNLVLGVILYALLFVFIGSPSLEIDGFVEGTQMGDVYVCETTPVDAGDTIVKINGFRVFNGLDYLYYDEFYSPLEPMEFTMRSHVTGDLYEITLEPQITQRPMIGIMYYPGADNKYNGWEIADVNDSQNNGDPILKIGDYLTKINGKSVLDEDFDEFLSSIVEGDTLTLTYFRNGQEYEEECVYTMMKSTNMRGIYLKSYSITDVSSFLKLLKSACTMPYTIITASAHAIGTVFRGQEEVYNMVAGPVGMTSAVSEVVNNVDVSIADKLLNVLQMSGTISLGLVFTNLLPIPGLDGMQIVLIVVEMIIGHPLSKKSEYVLNAVGLVLLVGLALFALTSDIIRIIVE